MAKKEKLVDEFGELLTNQWRTPNDVYSDLCQTHNVYPTIDVCASVDNTKCRLFVTREMDALTLDWKEFAEKNGVRPIFWMNPPYSQNLLGKFVKKAWEMSQQGCIVLCLLPNSTGSKWFHTYVKPYAKYDFVKGRISFEPPPGLVATSNRGDSTVVVFGG